MSIVACDWYIFFSVCKPYVSVYVFFIFVHTYCMFVTVILSHRVIVNIQRKIDMQQYLLQIKNVVKTVILVRS